MSRKSQAYADGTIKFSWKVERQPDQTYRCVCKNDPSIVGLGSSEQSAIAAASKALTTAIDTGKTASQGPGVRAQAKDAE